jgi:acyl carrier protein
MTDVLQQVKSILLNVLQIKESDHSFDLNTPLLGAIAEFDSMTVVTIITALEDCYGFSIEDDEIDASIFETVGSLVAFVEGKLQAG